MLLSRSKKVRFAVVGAGWFGQAAVLPAFANAKNAVLAAIVSGDAEKRAALSKEYGVPAHPYEEYDALLGSGTVDAVYIVTPNAHHRAHSLAAARRGVHVLCEKPLAGTAADAEAIVTGCAAAGVKLMTAYREHFEAANMAAVEAAHDGTIGDPRLFTATLAQQVGPGASRLDPACQSSPLSDVGIYCINAARYLFRAEPEEVIAYSTHGNDPRFEVVPEMTSAVLKFPGGRLAAIGCGFGEASVSACQLVGTKGDLRLDPAFAFVGERTLYTTVGGKTKAKTFKAVDQIAPEIEHLAACILDDKTPGPDGHEGLIDLRIIEAIQASALKGVAVPVQPTVMKPRPGVHQVANKPAVSEPDLVNAAPPGES